jgi:hypothetical protein
MARRWTCVVSALGLFVESKLYQREALATPPGARIYRKRERGLNGHLVPPCCMALSSRGRHRTCLPRAVG